MSEWQPIETAPKKIISRYGNWEYGQRILAFPVHGEVARVRWWQSKDEKSRKEGYQNFLGDCGNAYHPTHWRHLPKPPVHL
jgi:hypothetical protein